MPGVFDSAMSLLEQAAIGGEQVVYNWQMLEPEGDVYDFSVIEQHFATTERLREGLAVQVQDRFFRTQAQWVLRYLLEDPAYGGGLAPQVEYPEKPGSPQFGWVAQQWNPVVRARYQALLRVVAAEFDGRIFALNLPETAIEIDRGRDATGFICGGYFAAEMENCAVARAAFQQSHVMPTPTSGPANGRTIINIWAGPSLGGENGTGLGQTLYPIGRVSWPTPVRSSTDTGDSSFRFRRAGTHTCIRGPDYGSAFRSR